jgi:hypothetical protein
MLSQLATTLLRGMNGDDASILAISASIVGVEPLPHELT